MVELPKYFQKRLKEDEEVVEFIRPFGLVFFWWFFLAGVLVFGSLYYMFYFFDFGIIGVILFVGILLLGLMVLLKTLIIWRFTAFLVTNQRIVDFDQYGLFIRQISEAPFENIQDITLEQNGFWATVLKFGTIKVQTASSKNVLELQHIRFPRDVHDNIMDIFSESKKATLNENSNEWLKDPKMHSLMEALEKTKEEVGEENFKQALDDWLKK